MLGSTAFPFFVFGAAWLEKTAEFLPGSAADAITEHVRTSWTDTPTELEQTEGRGLLD